MERNVVAAEPSHPKVLQNGRALFVLLSILVNRTGEKKQKGYKAAKIPVKKLAKKPASKKRKRVAEDSEQDADSDMELDDDVELENDVELDCDTPLTDPISSSEYSP
ncbi:hypothetical protein DID88_005654 [Monilinia fructigena]|uniref:Uncharacterized protein n=1 Tax=Monilinia fructigena TaxID=38457 RepID=A0A395J2S7_9HELO|nr:hypothetical protein DID88_005654 [Monilinia fructigena]